MDKYVLNSFKMLETSPNTKEFSVKNDSKIKNEKENIELKNDEKVGDNFESKIPPPSAKKIPAKKIVVKQKKKIESGILKPKMQF